MNLQRVPELLTGLAEFLPAYSQRPGQLQMAVAVAEAIGTRRNLVVEGGTGIGKSMAYLVPALLSVVEDGARVLIATSHKPLQDQIARKDLPLLERLFAAKGYRPFKSTTLKGLSNYLCWQSAESESGKLLADPLADRAVRHALASGPDFSGDFEEFPFNLPPDTRQTLSATSEDCLGMRCPHRDRCYALKIRKRAEEADIVVTNHALLSLDIKSEGALIPGNFATYVIDEGHNFEENATRANGLQATVGAVRRLVNHEIVRRAAITSTTRLQNARDDLDKFQNEVAALFVLRQAEGGRFGDAEDENKVLIKRELGSGRTLAASLKELLTLVKNSPPRTEEELARAQRLLKAGASLIEQLERISANADPNLVYYAERTFYGGPARSGPEIRVNGKPLPGSNVAYALYAMPIDVSGYLAKWFKENQTVLTSATLSDGQSFDFFVRRVGLDKPDTLVVPSPFNYRERVKLFLPRPVAPEPGQGYTATLARQIGGLLNLTPGRALLLFTSHMMLEGVWRQLNGPLKERLNPARPFFKQGEAQMGRIIQDFQETEHGVVFGTRSWWQGVDLPGMRLLVMDKLPFPQLNDPIVKARIEEIEAEGGSSFNQFMLPLAIITFRQGFGRLMRQENDRGVVVVCDERIVQKSYGRRFLKSLPDVAVLPNVEQLKAFLGTEDLEFD